MVFEGVDLGPHGRIPERELKETASLSGGPGGQHANKTASRVTLIWSPLESDVLSAAARARLLERLAHRISQRRKLAVHVDHHRSQHQNRLAARARLGQLITQALKRSKRRRKTQPSRRSKERRLEGKRQRAQTKQGRRRPTDSD